MNYHVWRIRPFSGVFTSIDLQRHLVGWAVLAANSHNVQPWRFILWPDENRIDICLDPAGVLSASDKHSRQAYISVGCALENLVLAAKNYNLETRVEYNQSGFYPMPAASVFLAGIPALKSEGTNWFVAMIGRRMNRGKYEIEVKLPDNLAQEFQSVAQEFGLVLSAMTDVATRITIAEVQYFADKAVVARNDFRKELSKYLLPNDTVSGRGMPGNTFGLSDEMAKRVNAELSKDGEFDPDIASGIAITDRDGIRSSPLIGVISVAGDKPEWWLKAGRAFQRMALIAELRGVAMAVNAAMVEVQMFNFALRVRLGILSRPTIVFRVGYSFDRPPHSPRMAVEEVSELGKK